MDDVPDTRDSLLIRVASSGDQGAREQFARIYRPVVYIAGTHSVRSGLPESATAPAAGLGAFSLVTLPDD